MEYQGAILVRYSIHFCPEERRKIEFDSELHQAKADQAYEALKEDQKLASDP